jgi:serine/threonine protein kinase
VPYTAEIDIWSVGCIFAELMTAYLLFGDETEMDVLYAICKTYRLAIPPQVAGGHPTLGLPGVQEGGPAELPPGKVVTSASRGDSRPWLPSSGFWMPPSGLCIQAAVNQSPSERECIKPPKRMCDTCHTARQPTPPLPLPSVRRSPVSSPRAHPLHAFQSPAPPPRAHPLHAFFNRLPLRHVLTRCMLFNRLPLSHVLPRHRARPAGCTMLATRQKKKKRCLFPRHLSCLSGNCL